MILRCAIDHLILYAEPYLRTGTLVAFDGDEPFAMERVEAAYYELVESTLEEVLWLERAGYRLLRRAADFRFTLRLKRA
jgi:hypothetical protein